MGKQCLQWDMIKIEDLFQDAQCEHQRTEIVMGDQKFSKVESKVAIFEQHSAYVLMPNCKWFSELITCCRV